MSTSGIRIRRLLAGAGLSLLAAAAQATAIRLEGSAVVAFGSTFQVSIVADIDSADEIIGFLTSDKPQPPQGVAHLVSLWPGTMSHPNRR